MLRRTASALVGAIAVLLAFAAPAHATVAILAVDPTTGQVGVAAASCVQYDLARIVTLVPGTGVAVSQGHARTSDPVQLLTALRSGATSEAALEHGVRSPLPDAAQYAVVTLGGGSALEAGANAPRVTADDGGSTVMAIGNDLPNIAVVHAAGMAFAKANGDLATRLLAALQASSAAGGDRRCFSQRATAALIMVASPGQDPIVPIRGLGAVKRRQAAVLGQVGQTIAADQVGDLLREAAALKRPTGPGKPDLYLSLIQPAHGFNAVELLAQAYRQLRASPTPSPVVSPTATGSPPPATAGSSLGERVGWVVAWVALGLVALAAWWTPRRRARGRAQEDDVDEVGASRSGP